MNQEKRTVHLYDDSYQKHIKAKIFQHTKILLNQLQDINPLLFYLLFIIEAIQILWFSIHPYLQFLGQPFLLQYLRLFAKYSNFQGPLRQNNQLLMPFMIVSFIIILMYTICFCLSLIKCKRISKEKLTYTMKILLKTTAILIILLNTVLTIPIFNISLITLLCNKDISYFKESNMECFGVQHIVYCAMSILNIIVIAIGTSYFWFIFYIKNPFSQNYFAASSNLQRLAKFVIKLIPPIYFLIDDQKGFQDVYMFIYFGILLFNLITLRFLNSGQYSQRNFSVQFFIQNIVVWFSGHILLSFYLRANDATNLVLIQTVISSLLFSYGALLFYRKKQTNFLLENLSNKAIKKGAMIKMMQMLIQILHKNNQYIPINNMTCLIAISQAYLRNQMDLQEILHCKNIKSQKAKNTLVQFFIHLIENFKKENSAAQLKFMWISMLFEKGNRIVCFHEIAQINQDKLSVADQFMFYIFKTTHKLIDEESIRDSDENLVQIQKYLSFSQTMNQFEKQIENSAKLSQQFWQQLCQEIPSTKKCYNLAFKIHNKIMSIQSIFGQIQKIFPQNTSSVFLYNAFLSDVGTNFKQKIRIQAKIVEMSKKNNVQDDGVSQRKIKFHANENMGVINIGTINSNLGTVLNSNSMIKNLLGFDRIQVVGQKVTKIMPKIYKNIHDGFIINYLSKADQYKLPVEKIVYGMKKDLKIIELYLAVKVFPSIQTDFQLIGFFKPKKYQQESAFLMLDILKMEVIGMSEGFLELTNNSIKLSQAHREFIKINQLFPEFNINKQLRENEEIPTILKFTDCTDKLIELDDNQDQNNSRGQQVSIVIRQIKQYQNGSKMAILEINSKSKMNSCLSLQKKVHDTYNIRSFSGGTKKDLLSEIQRSYNYDVMDEDYNVTTDKKVKDYIKKQSFLKQMRIARIILTLLTLAFIGGNVFLEFNQIYALKDINNMLQEIVESQKIMCSGALTVYLNERAFQVYHYPQIWQKIINEEKIYVQRLENSMIKLFEKASLRDRQQLQINQQKSYDFITGVDASGSQQTELSLYVDGMFQIIFLSKQTVKRQRQQFENPSSEMKQSKIFIKKNLQQLVPEVNFKIIQRYTITSNQLSAYVKDIFIILLISRSIGVCLIFVCLLLLLEKFNKFNLTSVAIYAKILKWDAYELESRCRKFIIKHLDDRAYEKNAITRDSQLIKIIPKSMLLELTNIQKNNKFSDNRISINIGNKPTNNNKNSKKYLSLNEVSQKNVLKSFRTKSSFDRVHASEKVNLKPDFTIKKKYPIGVCLLGLLIVVEIIFLFILHQRIDSVENFNNQLIDFGKFTKTTLYAFYFGYQVLKFGPLKEQQIELSRYYQASRYAEKFLGSPRKNLKSIYFRMENLNALIASSPIENATTTKMFLEIQSSILQQVEDIVAIRQKWTQDIVNQNAKELNLFLIYKLTIQVFLCLLFLVYILHSLIQYLQVLNIKSSCLLQIIPLWLINKNQVIKQILVGSNSEDIDPQGSKIISSRKNIHQEFDDQRKLLQVNH